MRRRHRPAQELRAAIDRLPLGVREAVLEGIKSQRIIAGAHADGAGGACPMAAAGVHWQQVSPASVAHAQEAARAWDRYADAANASHPASRRQLLALRAMLEASILEESPAAGVPLSAVIAEHERTTEYERSLAPEPVPAAARRISPEELITSSPTTPTARPPVRQRLDTGERNRTSELREQVGWAWLRPFRNYDDYEEALRTLPELQRRAEVELADRAEAMAR
ncbi:MAG: hypothetical protein ACR2QA_08710 [Solirubrobacteraceae bacterium]